MIVPLDIIENIGVLHRQEKSLMTAQHGIASQMLSLIRIQLFNFDTRMPEALREDICEKTEKIVEQCRLHQTLKMFMLQSMNGASDDELKRQFGGAKKFNKLKTLLTSGKAAVIEAFCEPYAELEQQIADTDRQIQFRQRLRDERIKDMEKLAPLLPGYGLVEAVSGYGDKMFAQLVGECGDLTNRGHPFPSSEDDPYEGPQGYCNKSKLWARIGAAPFEGHALSTYLRESWRPRKLSSLEWEEHPYPQRRWSYLVYNAELMLRHQISRKKACERLGLDPESEEGKTVRGDPVGPYGEIYCRRRDWTDRTHPAPDPRWPNMHRHRDAIRYTAKKLYEDQWIWWNRDVKIPQAIGRVSPTGEELPAEREATCAVNAESHLPPAEISQARTRMSHGWSSPPLSAWRQSTNSASSRPMSAAVSARRFSSIRKRSWRCGRQSASGGR